MMLKMDEKLSYRVSNAGFLAACLVVGIHITAKGSTPVVCSLAVPFFFMVSGFLLAGKCFEDRWYVASLKKRMATLLIPYLIINGVWFSIQFGMHAVAVKFAGADPNAIALSWTTSFAIFGLLFPETPFAVGMWYVRTLLLFVLVSPLVVMPIRKSIRWAVLIVVIVCAVPIAVDVYSVSHSISGWWGTFLYFGFSPVGFACFTIGIALRCWARRIEWHWIFSAGLGIAAALLHCFGGRHCGFLFTVVAIAALWGLVPVKKGPRWLVGNSFPLFVMHPMLLYFISYFLKGIHCRVLETVAGGYVGWVLLIPLTCAVSTFIKSRFPRCAKLVFGGR